MTRTVDFHYYAVRDGANFCELFAPEGGEPSITMDNSGSIKTKLSGSFLPPEREVDWLRDEIRPVLVLDGAEYHLGRFLPVNVSTVRSATSTRIQVEALDRGWIVRDCRTEDLLYFAAGTKYLSAIGSVLISCGIADVSVVESDEVLAENREDWPVGTSCLDIVNQLLSEINYKDLWFDKDGMARLEPKPAPLAGNLLHTLDERQVTSLMIPGMSQNTDIHSAPNVFICVCSNADKNGAMRAVAENTNPQSPLSITRRGRRITKVVQLKNIASQAELQLYADRMVTDSLLRGDVFNVTSCLLPGFGVDDLTALRYGEISAICRETAWSMDLRVGGQMSHTLERVVLNLE